MNDAFRSNHRYCVYISQYIMPEMSDIKELIQTSSSDGMEHVSVETVKS
jgi:hypothetical protein